MSTNLLKEITEEFDKHNYSFKHVAWIGTKNGIVFDTSRFLNIAATVEYDSGYGLQEIRPDLVIKMCDGAWFSRREYDGSEWFEYHKAPSANDMKPLVDFNLFTDNYFYGKEE